MRQLRQLFSVGLVCAGCLLTPFSLGAAEIGLESTANWNLVIEGATDMAKLGTSMVNGDFNGDGVADLAVGAPAEDSPRGITDTGAVSVFLGGSTFQARINQTPQTTSVPALTGASAVFYGALNGYAGDLLRAGDLNGDGVADLIIVAQKNSNYTNTKVHVVYGRAQFTGTLSASVTLNSPDLGMHVAALGTGDINGDGIADLAIVDDSQSQVYVVYGSRTLAATINVATSSNSIVKRTSGTGFAPRSVAIGDLNGDGRRDLAIGAPTESDPAMSLVEMGRVFVRFGSGTHLPATLDVDSDMNTIIQGGLNKERAGERLVFGDVNGDNIADLVMGAPNAEQEGVISTTGFGKVRVVFGRTALPPTIDLYDQASMTLRLTDTGRLGFYVGRNVKVADVNKDGIGDLIISAPFAKFNSSQNGWVFVVYGSRTPVASIALENANLWLQAPEPVHSLAGGGFGHSLAVADFNNDGKMDIAGGALQGSYANNQIANGWAMVILSAARKAQAGYVRVFNWAEAAIPSLLPANNRQEMVIDPFKVRFYSSTGTYLGFNPLDNRFYAYNPALFGPSLVTLNTLGEFLPPANQAGF